MSPSASKTGVTRFYDVSNFHNLELERHTGWSPSARRRVATNRAEIGCAVGNTIRATGKQLAFDVKFKRQFSAKSDIGTDTEHVTGAEFWNPLLIQGLLDGVGCRELGVNANFNSHICFRCNKKVKVGDAVQGERQSSFQINRALVQQVSKLSTSDLDNRTYRYPTVNTEDV
jgi:hypothetical protein